MYAGWNKGLRGKYVKIDFSERNHWVTTKCVPHNSGSHWFLQFVSLSLTHSVSLSHTHTHTHTHALTYPLTHARTHTHSKHAHLRWQNSTHSALTASHETRHDLTCVNQEHSWYKQSHPENGTDSTETLHNLRTDSSHFQHTQLWLRPTNLDTI